MQPLSSKHKKPFICLKSRANTPRRRKGPRWTEIGHTTRRRRRRCPASFSFLPLPSSGLSPALQVKGHLLRNQKTKNTLPQGCWWGGNTRRPKNNLVSCCILWQKSGRSQIQELLCSLRLLGEERRNSPICPRVYCKTSTAPQSRFFRLLIFVSPLPPFFFFLWLISQFSEFFRQLVDYETDLQIRCFRGLTEATGFWTSVPTVLLTALRACVITPGATFIPS